MLSDPFGAMEGNGLRETIQSMKYYQDNPSSLPSSITLTGESHRRTQDWATDASHLHRHNQEDSGNPGSRTADDSDSYVGIRNIHIVRSGESGYAVANIYNNYREGPIRAGDRFDKFTWSGDVYVGADVTVESGATLTIANGATVYFLSPKTPDGTDSNGRAEIIVRAGGALNAGHGVTFRSTEEEHTDSDGDRVKGAIENHGLTIDPGANATLGGLTIHSGTHTFSGKATINGDLSVGDPSIIADADRPPAKLKIKARSEFVVASKSDANNLGSHPNLVEILVQKGSTLQAKRLTVGPLRPNYEAHWHGFTVEGALKFANGVTLKSGLHCINREGRGAISYPGGGRVTMTNCGVISGRRAALVKENSTPRIDSYSVTPLLAQFGPGRWTLTGDDAGPFSFSSGRLSVTTAFDYERAEDEGGDNVYNPNIRYSVGQVWSPSGYLELNQEVAVEVSNVEETDAPEPPTVTVDAGVSKPNHGVFLRLAGDRGNRIATAQWRVSYVGPDGEKTWLPGNEGGTWTEEDIPEELVSDWEKEITWTVFALRRYTVEARVANAGGYSGVTEYILPAVEPEALTVTGPTHVLYWTDNKDPVGTYTALGSDGNRVPYVSWSAEVTNDQAARGFEINSGVLKFERENEDNDGDGEPDPNGVPMDLSLINFQNRPLVRVTADSPLHNAAYVDVDIEIRENHIGEITLTNNDPPRATISMRATLYDRDNLRNLKWSWHKVNAATQQETEIYDGTTNQTVKDSYEPTAEDVGFLIRVTAHYNDAHSSDIDLPHTTAAVEAEPPTIEFARPGTVKVEGLVGENADTPRVGTRIEASLEDPNDPTSIRWSWDKVNPVTNVTTPIPNDNNSSRYKPKTEDLGFKLKVTATYDDRYAVNEEASYTTTRAVVPDNTPTAPNGSIVLEGVGPPRVNQEITARVEDRDGVRNELWSWNVVGASSSSTRREVGGHAFTPGSNDEGRRILVTVVYDDRHSTGITLRKTTEPVAPVVTLPPDDNHNPTIDWNAVRLRG